MVYDIQKLANQWGLVIGIRFWGTQTCAGRQ